MTISNPYVENLVQMGYDRKDVETASTMFQKKTFPYTIHGRTYQTEEEYNAAIHEFMNGMWQLTKWHTKLALCPKWSIVCSSGEETTPTLFNSHSHA